MANIDEKYRLNLLIGKSTHSIPLYDSYAGFYNGQYMSLQVPGRVLYANLSPERSPISVEAGIIKGNNTFYFLSRSFF